MSKETKDEVNINIHFRKSTFEAQLTIAIGLALIFILSQNSAVHVACVLLGILDVIALLSSLRSKEKQDEKNENVPSAGESEKPSKENKPVNETRQEVQKEDSPQKKKEKHINKPRPLEEKEKEAAKQDVAADVSKHDMNDAEWEDFFSSLDDESEK